MSKRDQFEVIKSRNLPKIGAAKHKVGGSRLKLIGQPHQEVYNKLYPRMYGCFRFICFAEYLRCRAGGAKYGTRWHQFMTNLYLFLFCRWMRRLQTEDRAEISPTCSATYVENTPMFLIGSQSQVSWRVLIMLILVLNLLTRIKLGCHT